MNCESNYYCKCEKCEESRNNILCPFCKTKIRSIEKCHACNHSLKLSDFTAKELKELGIKKLSTPGSVDFIDSDIVK